MRGEWYVRSKHGDGGPYTLQDLAERIQRGEIHPDDRARREGEVWLSVRQVIATTRAKIDGNPGIVDLPKPEPVQLPSPGHAIDSPTPIVAAAPKVTTKPAVTRPTHAPTSRPQSVRSDPSWWASAFSGRTVAWISSLIGFAVIVGLSIYFLRVEPTFPVPVAVNSDQKSPERQEALKKQLLASRDRARSIPGLKNGVPVLVPGLEGWKTAFSPTLTADLKTIVFAAIGNPKTLYDLYVADRNSASAPFGTPKIIQSCVSPETEAYPTISADGLSLIFIRSDSAPVLFHSRRLARDQEFGDAVIWEEAMKLADGAYVAYPQHLVLDRAAFSFKKASVEKRKLLVLGRPDLSAATGTPENIPMIDPSCPYFFAKSELRAYFAWDKGLAFAVRGRKDQEFGLVETLLPAEQVGPAEGSVWVTPSEDVVFYCSPGVGGKVGLLRQLWMVQF